jgi:hypothetical protein
MASFASINARESMGGGTRLRRSLAIVYLALPVISAH